MKNKSPDKAWSDRSPEEREQIKLNRECGNNKHPFSGKNRAQCNALHGAFNAMASPLRKMGMAGV